MGGEPVYLTRRGRRVAAIVDVELLEGLLEAADDVADLQAVDSARTELDAGAVPIPWDEVKADLGLA